MKKTSIVEYLANLESACQWLSVESGRAARYGQIIRDLHEKGARSREHILAHGESSEIVDIFQLWEHRINDYPGLEKKIRVAFRKGPLLREDENFAASSNRARNDAFVFVVAGTLLKASIPVVAVEGVLARQAECDSEADITFRSNGKFIDIECKRPQTHETLVKRAKEAREQIERPSREGRHGVIALDCSVLIRPAGTIYESESLDDAEHSISRVLETSIMPTVSPCLTDPILGFILFARVPAMTRSVIVTSMDKPIFRPDCISSWVVVGNRHYTDPEILRCVANRLQGAVRAF